jgi:alpha-tubulin suppressor-like RCC1 family protein
MTILRTSLSICAIVAVFVLAACGSSGGGTQSFSESYFADIAAVAAGYEHSLAVKSDGSVWAWGSNERSQLGTEATDSAIQPQRVSGIENALGVAAGKYHSLALLEDGTVVAWGRNVNGQLGNGTEDDSPVPVSVTGLADVIAIAAGDFHNMALTSNGSVWAWGKNTYGQLGNDDTQPSSIPVLTSVLADVVAIAAGSEHSMAVTSDGSVWAWGRNTSGQLGTGETNFAAHSAPAAVGGVSGASDVAAGWGHSAAITSEGAVLVWGDGDEGQIGDGSTASRYTPTQTESSIPFLQIASGYATMAAITSDGYLWTWGRNGEGQLGIDSSVLHSALPVAISDEWTVREVSCGQGHCLAIDTLGSAWAWGLGTSGQIGDGTSQTHTVPVQVKNP